MAKILIIEDDKQLNDLYADIVKKMGHESRRAFSLDEGWKELGADGFDVILLDVRLPDGDGLQALSKSVSGERILGEIIDNKNQGGSYANRKT